MSKLIEDALTFTLAVRLSDNRPAEIPALVTIQVANRDELRSLPCVVLAVSETKPVTAMRHTVRLKFDIHPLSQVDGTQDADHAIWANALVTVLAEVQTQKGKLKLGITLAAARRRAKGARIG